MKSYQDEVLNKTEEDLFRRSGVDINCELNEKSQEALMLSIKNNPFKGWLLEEVS